MTMNFMPQIADCQKPEMEILQNLDLESFNPLMNMMEQIRLNGNTTLMIAIAWNNEKELSPMRQLFL